MSITHTTPADGTFSGTGATAWNADHQLAESGGQALSIGSITDGQFLKRVGTAITSATGTSVSTPTFPGGIPLSGVSYPAINMSAVSTGDTDLYTVPAGKKAMWLSLSVYNNSGVGAIAWYPQVKIGGSYYRLTTSASTNNGVAAIMTNVGYIAEAGEILALNTATNNGLNVWGRVIVFDDSVPVKSAKILSVTGGADTVYTCPALTTALLVNSQTFDITGGQSVTFVNSSGGGRNIIWYVVPSGSAVGAGFQMTASTAVSDLTRSAITFLGASLDAGDFIAVDSDAATATQWAWVNVMEIT